MRSMGSSIRLLVNKTSPRASSSSNGPGIYFHGVGRALDNPHVGNKVHGHAVCLRRVAAPKPTNATTKPRMTATSPNTCDVPPASAVMVCIASTA